MSSSLDVEELDGAIARLRRISNGELINVVYNPMQGVPDDVLLVLAALETESRRLDWLDDRGHYWAVTSATNMIGIEKGWTYRRPNQSLDAIGERCFDVREAIDKAIDAWKGKC